ncbi:MAG TPA: hypothetical protein VKA44_08475 [Gemmatimonadota bacterium]|nr:hypothetical protein [Gemmatimonadota bacterium]
MGYLWTGFVLTWVAMAWFAWRLEARARDVGRRLRRMERTSADEQRRPEDDRVGT